MFLIVSIDIGGNQKEVMTINKPKNQNNVYRSQLHNHHENKISPNQSVGIA